MSKVKISDLICTFFEEKGVKNIFLLSGGMMMHLLDSVSKSKSIKYVCNHHEQACSIAAEAYARCTNEIGVCYATSGPGATNTVTGITGAWLDSSPVIYITGQSRKDLTVRGANINDLRMLGNFEVDIVKIVEPITKYAVFIDDPKTVLYHLEKAFFIAKEGRPGPVLLDIPLDIQGAMVEESELIHFSVPSPKVFNVNKQFAELETLLSESKKPLIIGGHGIRVANQIKEFALILEKFKIPVVTTQLANDLLEYNSDLYVGKVGLRGDRAGNFAVQTADLIIVIASSLHITTTGYELAEFAPLAKKVAIDIDAAILKKNASINQLQINCDVETTFRYLMNFNVDLNHLSKEWIEKLLYIKRMYSVRNEPHKIFPETINTYLLVDKISEILKGDEIIIADSGSLYYIVGQAFKTKKEQRVIISGALGAMGYALPAAVGACFAEPLKNVISLIGDGSMQVNIQELQTVSNYKLNCKIIIINNKGYASIRNTQSSFLDGHIAASSESSGVTFPNWKKIADAYDIDFLKVDSDFELIDKLNKLFDTKGPLILEVVVPDEVIMIPAVTSRKLPNGGFESNKLDDMSPLMHFNFK